MQTINGLSKEEIIRVMRKDGAGDEKIKAASSHVGVLTYIDRNDVMFTSTPLHFGEKRMEKFRKDHVQNMAKAKRLAKKLP